MAKSAAEYGLDEAEFRRAIIVLDQVEQSLRLSRWQRLSYRLYNILVVATVVFCISLITSIVTWDLFPDPNDWSVNITILPESIGIIAFFGALASIPLNLPLLIKVREQKLRLRRMGVSDSWVDLSRALTGRNQWGAIIRGIALAMGFLLIVIGLLGSLAGNFALLASFGGLGLILVVFYLLQEGKIWLDIVAARFNEIGHLKAELANLGKQEAGRIAIPTELVEKFAKIQTDHILFDRANAIAEFESAGDLFSVLTSRRIIDQKAVLNVESRIKVEEAIEELMQEPKSVAAKIATVAGLMSYPIDGTDLEIVYAIDEKEHRLRLIELRPLAARTQHA